MALLLPNANSDVAAHEIVSALKDLDAAVDKTFRHIQSGIDAQHRRIRAVNERLQRAEATLDAVSKARSAPITLFSSSVFPRRWRPSTWESLKMDGDFARFMEDLDAPHALLNPLAHAHEDGDEDYERMHLQSRHLWEMTRRPGPKAKLQPAVIMEEERLGWPPRTAATVADLMVFGTDVSAYSQAEQLVQEERIPKASQNLEEPFQTLPSAPLSLIQGDSLPDIEQLNYSYRPGEMSAAELALPENLPLPDVAELSFQDMYATSSGQDPFASIAPSVHLNTSLGDLLPELNLDTDEMEGAAHNDATQNGQKPPGEKETGSPDGRLDAGAAQGAAELPNTRGERTTESSPLSDPDPAAAFIDASEAQNDRADLASAEVTDGKPGEKNGSSSAPRTIGSLLDEIRRADVQKLRGAGDRRPKREKPASAPKPMTFMDEIRSKMRRRSEAISGKRDRRQQRRDSMKFEKGILDFSVDTKDPASSDDSGYSSSVSSERTGFGSPRAPRHQDAPRSTQAPPVDINGDQATVPTAPAGGDANAVTHSNATVRPPLERKQSLFDNDLLSSVVARLDDEDEDVEDSSDWED